MLAGWMDGRYGPAESKRPLLDTDSPSAIALGKDSSVCSSCDRGRWPGADDAGGWRGRRSIRKEYLRSISPGVCPPEFSRKHIVKPDPSHAEAGMAAASVAAYVTA